MPFAFAGCGAGAGFAVNPFGRVPCGFVCAGAGAGFGFGADSALKHFGIVQTENAACRCMSFVNPLLHGVIALMVLAFAPILTPKLYFFGPLSGIILANVGRLPQLLLLAVSQCMQCHL